MNVGQEEGVNGGGGWSHYHVERKTVYHSHPLCMPNDAACLRSTLSPYPFRLSYIFFFVFILYIYINFVTKFLVLLLNSHVFLFRNLRKIDTFINVLIVCQKMIKCTHRRVVEEDLIALADYGKKGELKFK